MYTRNKWKESSSSPPAEKHSTSLKAEALRTPATEIQNRLPRAHIFIGVFLALHSLQKDYLNELTTVLSELSTQNKVDLKLQWIPACFGVCMEKRGLTDLPKKEGL